MSSEEFDKLCAEASSCNKKLGITGLLLNNDQEFMQCIEGEAEKLKALYSKIVRDPRHCDIHLIESEEADARLFDDWYMQGSHVSRLMDPGQSNSVYSLLDLRLRRSWRSLGAGAANLIYEFARVKHAVGHSECP